MGGWKEAALAEGDSTEGRTFRVWRMSYIVRSTGGKAIKKIEGAKTKVTEFVDPSIKDIRQESERES